MSQKAQNKQPNIIAGDSAEITNLNIADLDVQELEQRLELAAAVTDLGTPDQGSDTDDIQCPQLRRCHTLIDSPSS